MFGYSSGCLMAATVLFKQPRKLNESNGNKYKRCKLDEAQAATNARWGLGNHLEVLFRVPV